LVVSATPARGHPAPDALALHVRGKDVPDATVDCSREKQRWVCDVPAAPVDLRFAAPGFVPHYLWDVRAEPGKRVDAGTLALRPGVSISGRAAVSAREDRGPITITLSPDAFTDTPRQAILQTFRATTNDRGFFQIAGFEPGAWTVTASKEGWSAARQSIVVRDGGETVLPDTLMLQPLSRVELHIDPPLDIGGADWMVGLDHQPEWGVRVPIAHSAAREGRWQSAPVESGLYFITVTAADGTVVHRGGQMISAGMPPLPIRIDRIVVRGGATLGGEPAEASLTFDDNAGKRVKMTSDAEGRFEGAISRDARSNWRVHVTPKDTGATITVRNVTIAPTDGVADLELELPDGRVSGKTVDDKGNPVRATLNVYGDGVSAKTISAADGEFAVAGLPAGKVRLRAVNADGDSGIVAHTIRGADDEPFTVVLPRRVRTSITIATPSGQPYAGAVVRVMTVRDSIVDLVSSPAGRVPVMSPANDTIVYVTVVAPGYPRMMQAVALTGDDAARRVVLSPASGTVFVPSRNHPMLGIARAGMPLMPLFAWLDPPPGFGRTAVEGGHSLDLAPGTYRFCTDQTEKTCVTQTVTPGSRHRIEFTQ
jgi:hypothetical protein